MARAIALRQLTVAPRTRAQLAEAMARREVPAEVAAQVLERFADVGLVDDAEYARMWVESRHTGRGLARRALEHELRSRGVDAELAREAAGVVDEDAELAAAIALCRRRVASMRSDEPARRDRRLLSMLARKGYGPGVALRAIRAVCADATELDLTD
ncbi:MAG: regulatory protein RecX [Kineosporiaceae bacterium]